MKLTGRSTLLVAVAQVLLAASFSSPQGRYLSDDESGVRQIRETGDQRICRVVSTVEHPHHSEEERREFESFTKLFHLSLLEAEGIQVGNGDPCEGGTLELAMRTAKDEEREYFFTTVVVQYFAHEPTRENLGEAEPAWVKAGAIDPIRYKSKDADRDDWVYFLTGKTLELHLKLFHEFVSDWKEAHGTPS